MQRYAIYKKYNHAFMINIHAESGDLALVLAATKLKMRVNDLLAERI